MLDSWTGSIETMFVPNSDPDSNVSNISDLKQIVGKKLLIPPLQTKFLNL